jgi:hypothetical protein
MAAKSGDICSQYRGLEDSIVIKSGTCRDVNATVFSVVRDEMFFMPAFLDHYRRLGVEQFIILDDGSNDGTADFLMAQSDCLLVTSPFSFSQTVSLGDQSHRAGLLLKRALPMKFLKGKYAIYADADEFLLLPTQLASVPALFEVLRTHKIDCVAASLVEFYPETLSSLATPLIPASIEDLFSAYSFFDGHPLLTLEKGTSPIRIGRSVTARLFDKHGLDHVPTFLRWLPTPLARQLFGKALTGSVLKTPVARWTDEVYLTKSHCTTVPPTHQALLTVAHFKFTYDLLRRVKQSILLKSHA